ncbi:MAG: putative hydrophobic protein (TIGR00271 family) [Bacillariaceae sp.]
MIIASIIAALGLGSNSTATIIASMFVSPLMGPVIGVAYAATIGDCRMLRIAFFTESVSLLMCILVGAIVSGCMGFFEISEDWPTNEQESRATMQNFWVGIPIAFFSGLGVAVSVLDDHTSSLVGVAISASLLPPTVSNQHDSSRRDSLGT